MNKKEEEEEDDASFMCADSAAIGRLSPSKFSLMKETGRSASKLFFIRHAETVDNVERLLGGVRDAPLTVHGVQQADRLAGWLAANKPDLTHIFSSDLQRARKTADAIKTAQEKKKNTVEVVQLRLLQEQNFGAMEGKPWSALRRTSTETLDPNADSTIESKESMTSRADDFIDHHLLPLFRDAAAGQPFKAAIVSHGIILGTLWRELLKRQSKNNIAVYKRARTDDRPIVLEHLGSYSNTGFLEVDLSWTTDVDPTVAAATNADEEVDLSLAAATSPDDEEEIVGTAQHTHSSSHDPKRWMKVMAINSQTHLAGLKRIRGGIGSSAHDEQQQSITSFFKKPRLE